MNYEPNQIDWQLGDIVIHDADAKREDMLMVVVGIHADEDAIDTIYLDQRNAKGVYSNPRIRYDRGKRYALIYTNPKEALHNPARFGIMRTL